MRRLYRMTLQRPEMDSQGQIAPTHVSSMSSWPQELLIRDLMILGRQRDDDSQNKLQINGGKDNLSYIINRMNVIQS